jgi:hypothetical protein
MGQDGIDNAAMYYLGTPKNAVTDHAGVVDHIAFVATEPGAFVRRFKERGLEYQPRSLPKFDLNQIFIKDPNGLTIELNFFGLKDVGAARTSTRCRRPPACGDERIHGRRLRRGDSARPRARTETDLIFSSLRSSECEPRG